MSERWLPAPGWPGYEASSLGRVRSVPRVLSDGRQHGGTVLTQSRDGKGYWRVRMRRGGRSYTVRVHDVIAATFIGPRPPGMQILHRNDDHDRNGAEDLRYGTGQENVKERTRRERRKRTRRKRNRTGGTKGRGKGRGKEGINKERESTGYRVPPVVDLHTGRSGP